MIDDGFRLLPEQASTHAPHVDLLYFFLIAMSVFFTAIIFRSSFCIFRSNIAKETLRSIGRSHGST